MVSILLACVACQPAEGPASSSGQASSTVLVPLALEQPQLIWRGETLGIETGLSFQPSAAIRDALSHGVAVTLVVETRIHPWRGWLASPDQTRNHRFEIRYLPLSEHYQLKILKSDSTRTYPRLRLLLADLAQRRWLDTHLTRSQLGEDEWAVEVRVDIDKEQLPAPMQLSVWAHKGWQTNTEWWRFTVTSSQPQGQ